MRYFTDKETIVSNEIEWLPSIPKTWNLCRLKDYAFIETGIKNTEDKIADGDYPFFVRSQTVEYSSTFSYEGEAILTAGDGVGVGKVFHHYNGKFETHQRVYRICKFKKIFGRFLFYFISENLSKETLKYNSKATVDSLRMPTFQRFPLLLPPIDVQIAIANFLDSKTLAIDKKITLLSKKVDYYKELRKSLIFDAVSKGLNKNIILKESGIEWIGKIPEHWVIKRLKDIATIKGGQDYKLIVSVDGLYPVYGSGGIFDKATKFLYNKPSVLLGRKGTIDKPLFVNIPFWAVDTMYYTEIQRQNNVRFFYYQCLTIRFDLFEYGSAVPSMTQRDLVNISFPSPPNKEEQTAIANYLDEKTQKIDAIVANIGKQIETLKELRKTLINDVVTGKIKVVGNL